MELLKASGKVVVEDGGVMPNPMVEKLAEGVRIPFTIRCHRNIGYCLY